MAEIAQDEPVPRACGPCSLCCKVLDIPQLEKPEGVWCGHFAAGRGCTIHPTRPQICRGYQCAWTLNPILDETWRPDVAGFLMEIRPGEVVILADPGRPDAWRREPYGARIKSVSARVQRPFTIVLVRLRERVSMVFPAGEVDLGPNQPGTVIDSGYTFESGMRVPYARFTRAESPPPA